MKATKLIQRLQYLVEKHGDLEVTFGDAYGDYIEINSAAKVHQRASRSHLARDVFVVDETDSQGYGPY